MRNEESSMWEDWLMCAEMNPSYDEAADSWIRDLGDGAVNDVVTDGSDLVPEKGLVESVRDMVLTGEDDDMLLYEDRVFQYVRAVPLSAQTLDVRRNRSLEMVRESKAEKARFRLEEEIGESPPLSNEEVWLELRHKGLELQDEQRLGNRKAFADIWSNMMFGVSLFLLLYLNQSKVCYLIPYFFSGGNSRVVPNDN